MVLHTIMIVLLILTSPVWLSLVTMCLMHVLGWLYEQVEKRKR